MNATLHPIDHEALPKWLQDLHQELREPTRARRSACWRDALCSFQEAPRRYRIALGRVRDSRGVPHDHAWLVGDHGTITDVAPGARDYVPLVLLSRDGAWLACPPSELPHLRPSFFLTMHCQINDEALRGVLSGEEIDDINHMNARVDDPFAHPNYDPREHFDNSMILESIALLEDRITGGRLHTVQTGAPSAVTTGLSCHAVADFYSHTNYAPMALAYYDDPDKVPTIDEAIKDNTFLSWVGQSWKNASMWKNVKGYSTTIKVSLDKGFERCLFSGGYAGDKWTAARQGIPHHDDFAVDQPDSALVHGNPILPRRHPFAFPNLWKQQYDLRYRLAVLHVQRTIQRAKDGDHHPFLGTGNDIPAVLVPPPWTDPGGVTVAASHALPIRDTDGHLT